MRQESSARQTQRACLELYLAGHNPTAISRQLDINVSTVTRAIKRAMKENIQPLAEEAIALEIARLDVALAAIWQQVRQGKLPAVDRLVLLSRRRAEITGLDAPTKRAVDTSFSGSIETTGTGATEAMYVAIMAATADDPETRYKIAAAIAAASTDVAISPD